MGGAAAYTEHRGGYEHRLGHHHDLAITSQTAPGVRHAAQPSY
jgi:hypothetical protein